MNQPNSEDASFHLTGRDVHIWTILIESPHPADAQLQQLLSPDEWRRAEQFRFKHLRDSFIRARAALRILLGRYLHMPPGRVGFKYNAKGKPGLAEPVRVKFNISHSNGLAVLAFALDCEIGIDVERIRPIPEVMNIAKTILCPAETAEWISLPAERREETFFRVWTRKEACVKAVGEGLSARLEDFRVPLLQTSPIVIDIRDNLNRTQIWTLHDLNLPSNYTGSVIYRDNLRPILFFNDLPIDA